MDPQREPVHDDTTPADPRRPDPALPAEHPASAAGISEAPQAKDEDGEPVAGLAHREQ